jgi:hypothetical protein
MPQFVVPFQGDERGVTSYPGRRFAAAPLRLPWAGMFRPLWGNLQFKHRAAQQTRAARNEDSVNFLSAQGRGGLIKSSAREQFSRFRFIARDLPLRPLLRNASRPKGAST